MVRFKNGLPFEEEESSSTNLGDHFLLNYIQRRPRRYHFLCMCSWDMFIIGVHQICRYPRCHSILGIFFWAQSPWCCHMSFLKRPAILVETSSKVSITNHPKKSLRILPHQTSVSWHPNIFKFGGSVKIGEPKPHPRRFNLGKSFEVILEPLTLENAKRPFVFLVLFLGDDWLKHIKTY